MRLRRVLSVIPCLLAVIPVEAEAQLKFKLSGRANTKTVLVEASGMVTATDDSNVTQSTGWNGYGDFWKSAASQTFPVSGGITVKNNNLNESRNLTSLTFDNASGDRFTMGLNTSVTGGENHSFTLSGSARFQLLQSQTFGAIFGGGTFTTGTQRAPLGSGPILEIMEAPPAEIQVQIIPEGGGNSITTGYAQGTVSPTVRITNVGSGFAENVPYSVSFPGTLDYSGSPTTSFTGTIPFLKAGESHDFAYSLRFVRPEGSSPPYQMQASSSFADSNELNNSATVPINEIEVATDGEGTYWNTSITRPPEIPTLIPPLVQHTLNVGLTSTGGDESTVFQFTPPEGVFIDHIELQGVPPPGLRLIHGNAGGVWAAFIPPAPAGSLLNFKLYFHGFSGAGGDLTVTRAPNTLNAFTTTHELDFGPGGEAYELGGLVFEDVDEDGVRDLDEPACLGCRVHVTTADRTLILTSDLAGFVRAYLPPGPATVTIPGTPVSIPFTVPAEDFEEELPVSGLQPELAVEISLGGVDGVPLIVHAGEEIPAATVTITNKSGVTAFNVPVTVYYDDDFLDFAELENPVTGARTAFSTSFTVASLAPNSPLVVNVPLHRGPTAFFGHKITLRAGIDWSDANRHNNVDDTALTLLDSPPFDCEWTPPGGPVAAGSPVQLTGQLTSNGGSGTATVRVESTVGKILSILVPGATAAPVNLQNGTLWEFAMPVGAAGSQYPISVVGVVPSNGAANYTIRVLSTGPGIDESSATVAVTGDATPTVLVSGQVFYDANSNGMVDGGERLLPNWPVKVVDGAGRVFNLQADGAGNWGVFVAAGSGPGQASPGAGGGGAPGAGFGFVPLPGADVDLDVVVGPLELSGRAYVDRDSDAVYTPGTDVPFPGLTTYLGMSSATGQTTTTDADGRYLFTLPPDTPGFLLNPAETGGVARAHIVGLDEPQGFIVPRPVFGVHYVPDFTTGILPLVSTPLNALDFVMNVEPNLVTFDPPTAVNPKIRWPKRLGPGFIPEFNTTLAPNGWMEITSGRTEDAEYYYADLPAAPTGQLFIRLRRPVGGM